MFVSLRQTGRGLLYLCHRDTFVPASKVALFIRACNVHRMPGEEKIDAMKMLPRSFSGVRRFQGRSLCLVLVWAVAVFWRVPFSWSVVFLACAAFGGLCLGYLLNF